MASEGVQVARITITRTLTEDGDYTHTDAVDSNGEPLEILTALGMMAMAHDTLLHGHRNEEDC